MRACGWRAVVASAALAGCVVACGGGGGGGGNDAALLPLLPADELVALLTQDAQASGLRVCNAGARVYVAWVERSDDVPDRVFFDLSLDGGANWLPEPVPVSDAATEAAGLVMCCEGDRVYLAYIGIVGGVSAIRLNRSLDAGTTFLPAEVKVSDALFQVVRDPAICCDGLDVHVAWEDGRDGEGDIYYHRSVDGGATFPSTDVALESDTPGENRSSGVTLCCDGPRIYAAWIDGGGADTIRLNRSLDAGVTFLPTDVRVSHASTATEPVSPPSAVCAGTTVAVVWADQRNGHRDVFCNRSTDAGATFFASDRRLDTDPPGAATSTDPVACLEDGTLHVAWLDLRTGTSGARYNRSADAGATFLAEDVPLPAPPGSEALDHLVLRCEGSGLALAWSEDLPSDDATSIRVAVSTDGGGAFTHTRADTDASGASFSASPGLALDGDHLVVVWQVFGVGLGEVRTNRTR